MNADLAALLYLAAGVLFILALRGLSSPVTSRRGNFLGMTGMAIAAVTTLAVARETPLTWAMIIVGIAIGGSIGATVARRIPMTAMPELVAAFHSLVGMAAVLVAAAAFYAPEAFGIGTPGAIHTASLVEMSLGCAIGAITFSGSVIAFLKLSGRMSGKPILLPARHIINIALAALLVFCVVMFCREQTQMYFWAIAALSFLLGVLIIIPIGGADMPVVISMLNSYSGWAAAGIGFTLGNTALKWVFPAHPPDQISQAAINSWPPCPMTRFPTPKHFEPSALPTQDGLRPNHLHRTKKARPKPRHPYKKSAITAAQSKTRWCLPQSDG